RDSPSETIGYRVRQEASYCEISRTQNQDCPETILISQLECVDLLKAYTANRERKSEWLFDGWIPTEKRNNQKDKHLTTSSAYLQIPSVFEHPSVNLIPQGAKSDKNKTGPDFGPHQSYHPHVFRGTNLTITKSTGFPDSYAEFLVGHTTGSKEHYYNEDELGKLWLEKCEPSF